MPTASELKEFVDTEFAHLPVEVTYEYNGNDCSSVELKFTYTYNHPVYGEVYFTRTGWYNGGEPSSSVSLIEEMQDASWNRRYILEFIEFLEDLA